MPERVKIDLGFADLLCRKSDATTISRTAKSAYSFNRRFFETDIKRKFKIIICYSRKELDKEWGGPTESWLVACADYGRIATFPDRLIRKYSPRKDVGNLQSMLNHEISHQFYYQIVKGCKPSWLIEGLATQIDGYGLNRADNRLLKRQRPPLLYSHTGKTYWKHAEFLYPMGHAAVTYLMRKHGKAKMLRLLALYSKTRTKKGFEAAFRKTFGYSVKELEERVFGR